MKTLLSIPFHFYYRNSYNGLHHYGHGSSFVVTDMKFMLGCLIVLSVIYMFTSVFALVKYLKAKPKYESFDFSFDWYFFPEYMFVGIVNLFMTLLYSIFIILLLGSVISKYL